MSKALPNNKEKTIAESERICVDIYLCFHVSELTSLHEPTVRAWRLGQKIYSEIKNE